LNNENRYENSEQQTIDKIYLPNISGDYHGDDCTSAAVGENLATFIVKNLLSKDAIITFVVVDLLVLWPVHVCSVRSLLCSFLFAELNALI